LGFADGANDAIGLSFYTSNEAAPTEKMRITKTGNVGIGTASPSSGSKLQVEGNIFSNNVGGNSFSINSAGANYGFILNNSANTFSLGYGNSLGTVGSSVLTWNSSGNVGIGTTSPNALLSIKRGASGDNMEFIGSGASGYSDILFYNTDKSDRLGYIDWSNTQVRFNVEANIPLAFHTNTCERMRITSGGDLLIGRLSGGLTNSLGTTVSIGTIQLENTSYVFYGNRTTSDGLFMGIRRNNVDVGSITVTTSATAFNTSSDYRLKTDFKDYNGLSLINSIKTYDYAWTIDNTRAYGVKAHELQELLPYMVFGEKDATNDDNSVKPQAVDYSKLVPIAIKAIQEQQCEIKQLKLCLGIN
jgi:hypothetical protein